MIETKVCVTARHREKFDQVLEIFDILPDFDLNIMKENQDLYDISEKILGGMKEVLLDDSTHYNTMCSKKNPYGNGHEAQIIVKVILRSL